MEWHAIRSSEYFMKWRGKPISNEFTLPKKALNGQILDNNSFISKQIAFVDTCIIIA